MVGALLAVPPRRELPATLADHVGSCRSCSEYRHRLLAAAQPRPGANAYHPRLRARTLAAVAHDRERAWPGLWLWLPPASVACMIAAYGIPGCVLSNTFGSVLGSPGRGLAAALLVIGSWLVLLPASLAAALVRRTPPTNRFPLPEEKGVLS
jgi:hypothetical protein